MIHAKKNAIAAIKRPCTSCPKPGKKILHIAAITLPPEPCSAILTSVVFDDYTFYKHTSCQLIIFYKSTR